MNAGPLPASAAEHTVVVLGASAKPARYANQAQRLLMEKGYRVIPVHPKQEVIEGLEVVHALSGIGEPVHTLILYVGPQRSGPMIADIVAQRPGRVILNPGTESEVLERALDEHGIDWMHACTLVMLRTGGF